MASRARRVVVSSCEQVVIHAKDILVLGMNVMHQKASNSVAHPKSCGHEMSAFNSHLGLVLLGELFEADSNSDPCRNQKERQTVQQAFHCKVPPCRDVRVEIV